VEAAPVGAWPVRAAGGEGAPDAHDAQRNEEGDEAAHRHDQDAVDPFLAEHGDNPTRLKLQRLNNRAGQKVAPTARDDIRRRLS